jgi:hypothetical protein
VAVCGPCLVGLSFGQITVRKSRYPHGIIFMKMKEALTVHFSIKHVSKLLLLLALLSSSHAARPWSKTFGSCVFSGDLHGAPRLLPNPSR